MPGFAQALVDSGEDGPTLTNTTSAASLLQPTRKWSYGTLWFNDLGKRVTLIATGVLSSAAATPGNVGFQLKFGSTTVFDMGNTGTMATSLASKHWRLLIDLYLRVAGTSAQVYGSARFECNGIQSGINGICMPDTFSALGTAFDAVNNAQQVDLYGQFSVASSSNILICKSFSHGTFVTGG